MARRIRWQILIASVTSLIVLGLMGYLALTTAAVSRPLAGGTFVEALTTLPRQLNPLVSDPTREPASADIQTLVFEGLMRIEETGLPEPALAENWPEISDNGRVYTFTLRPDVTWHDGAPLTVDDVLFTLRAVQGPNFFGNPTAASLWRNVVIDKIGDRQIRCTLPAPFAPFLSQATFPILPAHLLADIPPADWSSAAFGSRPVGSGPYMIAEATEQHLRLTPNPDYHGEPPFLEQIEFRQFGTTQEATLALTRGEISAIGYPASDSARQFNLPNTAVRHSVPLDGYTVLTFNLREQPLSDQGLRRALATGLNKEELIAQVLAGQAEPLDTPILPGSWAGTRDIAWYAPDRERAGQLLAELGYAPGSDGVLAKDGTRLVLPLITDEDRTPVANEIARQWGELGIRVEVETLDPDSLRTQLEERSFTLALHGWQRLGPDPDMLELWHSERADSGRNYAGLEDERIDTLLETGRESIDPGARLAAYREFQQRWVELAPSIALYQPLYTYNTTAELGGLDFDRQPGNANAPLITLLLGREDRFRNVTRWFVRSSREIRGELRTAP